MKTIKKTLCLVLFSLGMVLTTQAQGKGVTLNFNNYDNNIQLLEQYVAAMKAGDAAKMNALFSDNAAIVGLGSTMDTITKKDHLARYTDSFEANSINITQDVYLSVKTDENAAVAPGEYGFSWGNVSITNKKSNKTATSRYHVVARIENGEITFLGHYYDSIPFLLQEGYTIVPPKE